MFTKNNLPVNKMNARGKQRCRSRNRNYTSGFGSRTLFPLLLWRQGYFLVSAGEFDNSLPSGSNPKSQGSDPSGSYHSTTPSTKLLYFLTYTRSILPIGYQFVKLSTIKYYKMTYINLL